MSAADGETLLKACESALSGFYDVDHAVLTGNGTVALSIAYRLMPEGRSKVLLPSVVCPNLIYAAQYAEKEVAFADVLADDATIDPDAVAHVLADGPDIGVVVAVHLYGHAARMDALRDICREHNVLLIEDVAQAMGGRDAKGRLLGTMGDCAVASFGHTKILETGGGGAIITGKESLARKATEIATEIGPEKSGLEHLHACYRRLFYAIWHSGQEDARFYRMFEGFGAYFADMYLYRMEPELAGQIVAAMDELPELIDHRRKLGSLYTHALEQLPGVKLFSVTDGIVPWRFSFLVDAENRDALLEHIRNADFDASSWYPCVANWFTPASGSGERYPVGSRIEKEIINLWVDPTYSIVRVEALVATIREYYEAA